jgi:hypothetical protein
MTPTFSVMSVLAMLNAVPRVPAAMNESGDREGVVRGVRTAPEEHGRRTLVFFSLPAGRVFLRERTDDALDLVAREEEWLYGDVVEVVGALPKVRAAALG